MPDRSVGRFAPSPSGPLHLGNLRTAVVAWCVARQRGGSFLVRMEDLTTGAAPVAEQQQLEDLRLLGLDFDGDVVRQSDRQDHYDAAIDVLTESGRTYPCFCTRAEVRRELAAAAGAPHGLAGEADGYPGTCRDLSSREVAARVAEGRRAAVRLRAESAAVTATDLRLGERTAVVDDFVLRRADGVAAYNLAVVVDDAAQGVDHVVRGDDLWPTTPRQVLLGQLLGYEAPTYVHVPLVLGADGHRLAKRHGAVGLRDQLRIGRTVPDIVSMFARSLGVSQAHEVTDLRWLARRLDISNLPPEPWIWDE
ncbi:MAG: tRNA glutamyl-Q(34) synthetase GluQRS [Actinomycetes bacterium]